jgi:hypothetical protein
VSQALLIKRDQCWHAHSPSDPCTVTVVASCL